MNSFTSHVYISQKILRHTTFCVILYVVVVVVAFFTLTDRASTIPSNIRGC